MSYRLIWEANGVVKHFTGYVDSDEVAKATADVEASPRFDNCRYVINDFLACTGFSYSPEVFEEIAAIDGAAALVNSNINIAVVAMLPALIEGINYYAASDFHPYPTRLFSTLAEARAWLAR